MSPEPRKSSGLAARDTAPPAPRRAATPELWMLVLVSWAVRGVFLAFLPEGAVSVDARSWGRVVEELSRGNNPYRTTTLLNWPPVWMQILYWLDAAADAWHLPFTRLLQGFLIGVETVALACVYRVVRGFFPAADVRRLLLFGICLNPVAIFQVCQHLNFDVLVGLGVLLTLAFTLAFRASRDPVDWLLSCAFLGLSILAKTVPFVLLPVCLLGLGGVSRKVKAFGLFLLLFPVCLGLGTIYVLAPEDVATNVLAYRSSAGYFGVSGLLQLIPGWNAVLVPMYTELASMAVLGLVAAAVLWSLRPRNGESASPLWLAVFLFMVVLVVGPGYASQYVGWFLPLLLVLHAADGEARPLLSATLVVAALTYTVEYALFWSHGGFLVHAFPSPILEAWSRAFFSPEAPTLVRLPLFVCYTVLLGKAFRSLWSTGSTGGAAPRG